jgi:hypothetical protein
MAGAKFDLFLESGMGIGLKSAIRYASIVITFPEQDRREIVASTTFPFGCVERR